jgi:hypothetical protein
VKDDIFSFVVRIWPESTDAEGNVTHWRGSVDQVGTSNRLYFHRFDRIVNFIQQQLGLRVQSPLEPSSQPGLDEAETRNEDEEDHQPRSV